LKIETSEDEDIKLRDPIIDTPIAVSDFEEMTIKPISNTTSVLLDD
jgi:hypothetical protein